MYLDPRTPLIASAFFRMQNDAGQSTTNDITKGVENLEAFSMGVGCLTMVDDP